MKKTPQTADEYYVVPSQPNTQNVKQSLVAVLLMVGAAIYALIGIAHPPEGTTITNEAISTYLFKSGQRMVARSNTTETTVQSASIAASLELALSEEEIVGNGVDSCLVQATVLDIAGNPVPDGQPVALTTTHGTFSNNSDTTYTLTVQGRASAWLKSVLINGGVPIVARAGAITYGSSGQQLVEELPLVFFAGGVKGRIVSLENRSVQGMIVVAYNDVREEMRRDTTAASGRFFLPLERSGRYTVAFRYRNAFDDDITIFAPTAVEVPSTGGVAAISPLNTIVGNLVDARNTPVRRSGVSVMLYRTNTSAAAMGRSTPALQFTDDRGLFAFDSLAPGDAELNVVDMKYTGKLAVKHDIGGMFVIDANVSIDDIPSFEINKTSNKRIVEIGDVVSYAVEMRNTNANLTLRNVRLIDELPPSFVFAKGSARRDGELLPNPDNTRRLEWFLADSLPPTHSIKVSYAVHVGAAALESNGINKAFAVAIGTGGDTLRTQVASVQVVVRPGMFTDRGIVIGKVFYDTNENGKQDDGERGIAGVELLMEDGTRVTTGDEGKYSLPEVRPGQHVIRLNQMTLPYGAALLAPSTEFAGDGRSRFIRLTESGIARADFYVTPPNQASLRALFGKGSVQKVGEEVPALYSLSLFEIGSPARISLIDTLPQGFYFDLNSITWRNQILFPQGKYSNTLWIDFPKRQENSADTITLTIVADSSTMGKTLSSRGKLVLAYPFARNAVFAASQDYGVVGKPQVEQVPVIAKKETVAVTPQVPAKSETTIVPQTTIAKKETTVTPRQIAAKQAVRDSAAAHSAKKPVTAAKSKKRGSTKPAADSAATQFAAGQMKQDTVQGDSSIVTEVIPAEPLPTVPYDSEEEYFKAPLTKALGAAAIIGTGALLFLIIFFLFAKKKKKENEE